MKNKQVTTRYKIEFSKKNLVKLQNNNNRSIFTANAPSNILSQEIKTLTEDTSIPKIQTYDQSPPGTIKHHPIKYNEDIFQGKNSIIFLESERMAPRAIQKNAASQKLMKIDGYIERLDKILSKKMKPEPRQCISQQRIMQYKMLENQNIYHSNFIENWHKKNNSEQNFAQLKQNLTGFTSRKTENYNTQLTKSTSIKKVEDLAISSLKSLSLRPNDDYLIKKYCERAKSKQHNRYSTSLESKIEKNRPETQVKLERAKNKSFNRNFIMSVGVKSSEQCLRKSEEKKVNSQIKEILNNKEKKQVIIKKIPLKKQQSVFKQPEVAAPVLKKQESDFEDLGNLGSSQKTKDLDNLASSVLNFYYEKLETLENSKNKTIIDKDPVVMLEKTKKKLKNLNYNLNGLLNEQGVSNSIEIQNFPPEAQTPIEIIDPNSIIYARINCVDRNLPVKLKLSFFFEECGKKYPIPTPEDLKIYLSMNLQEPTSKAHDRLIDFASVKSQVIVFGCSNRDSQKYPNIIYIGFETVKNPCSLEIAVQFEKSDQEKANERRIQLQQFKNEQVGLKAQLELMSPDSKNIELKQIEKVLMDYFIKAKKANEQKQEDTSLKMPKSESAMLIARKIQAKKDLRKLDKFEKNRLKAAFGENVLLPNKIQELPYDNAYQEYIESRGQVQGFPKKQEVKSSKNQNLQKSLDARLKKAQNEEQFRQSSLEKLKKWDIFRAEKQKYLDFTEKLLKKWVQLRTIIAQITLMKMLKHILSNFKLKKDKAFENMMRTFLSIKFKVSFKLKYVRRYGLEQKERYRHQIRRNFVMLSLVQYKKRYEYSQEVFLGCLNSIYVAKKLSEKFEIYRNKIVKIQSEFRQKIKARNLSRIEQIQQIIVREMQELSQRAQSKVKNNGLKDFKMQLKFLCEQSFHTFRKMAENYLKYQYLKHKIQYTVFKYRNACTNLDQIQETLPYLTDEFDIKSMTSTKSTLLLSKDSSYQSLTQLFSDLCKYKSQFFSTSPIIDKLETYRPRIPSGERSKSIKSKKKHHFEKVTTVSEIMEDRSEVMSDQEMQIKSIIESRRCEQKNESQQVYKRFELSVSIQEMHKLIFKAANI